MNKLESAFNEAIEKMKLVDYYMQQSNAVKVDLQIIYDMGLTLEGMKSYYKTYRKEV